MTHTRRYLIAGLMIWIPLGVTILVINMVVDLLDGILLVLPAAYHPDTLLGFHLPGLGVLLSIVIVLGTGMLAANLFGRRLVEMWEGLLARIPLVRSIYSGTKQVSETLFKPGGLAFRKVLLVEYPRRGLWCIAFQTAAGSAEAKSRTGEDLIPVFVPTTPNPTSGFILMVPRRDVIEMDMSVDDAIKMVISLGVVVPPWRGQAEPPKPERDSLGS
ncbi:MAG: DUF502 domain-containing protein [Gammaproteobacteria bacterium]|nr:MAG: DUF502 domain-containing protein [Gammaproteobacteria bacterium]